MAQAAGESEKALQGLHENYLEARVKDPRMEAVSNPSKIVVCVVCFIQLNFNLPKTVDFKIGFGKR